MLIFVYNPQIAMNRDKKKANKKAWWKILLNFQNNACLMDIYEWSCFKWYMKIRQFYWSILLFFIEILGMVLMKDIYIFLIKNNWVFLHHLITQEFLSFPLYYFKCNTTNIIRLFKQEVKKSLKIKYKLSRKCQETHLNNSYSIYWMDKLTKLWKI